MGRLRVWLLPALLAAAQLAYWPGLTKTQPGLVPLVLIVVSAAALGFRGRAPLPALAAVLVLQALGTWVVPGDALMVIGLGDLIVLFSVGVRCGRRATFAATAVAVAWQAGLLALSEPFDADLLAFIPLLLLVYGLIAAAGRLRARWHADRAEAARRLAQAQAAEREAAQAERRRLARELHDVTAHHLTSIVVNASAARMLAGQRPDLHAEAVEFAARTGRETLAALRRLVAVLPEAVPEQEAPVLDPADLVDDFRQLGQPIVYEVVGDGAVPAEAVHGILREALTNTLRYAAGAEVHVRLSTASADTASAGTDLLIENAAGEQPARGLGGGRGIEGMRERARALGGTLTAGPTPGGGWRVHAFLPTERAPVPRLRRWLTSQSFVDGALVVLTALMPASVVLLEALEEGLPAAPATLLLLALAAHSAPLLYRRQRPWTVLALVGATAWLGPLVLVTGVHPDVAYVWIFASGPELAAVYAVAARGARPASTWLAVPAAAACAGLALGVLMPTGELDGVGLKALLVLLAALAVALLLALPAAGAWLAGHAARRRRERRVAREEGAVATMAAQAEFQARLERARVAEGLRAAVLRHAGDVPRAAAEQDLDAVVTSARAALAAMRGLLDGLGGDRAGTREGVPSSPSV